MIVLGIILLLIALAAFVLSARQLACKGKLLNNTYFHDPKKERNEEEMKPYYRQSGIVFLLVGLIFFFEALNAFTASNLFMVIVFILLGAVIVYTIASTAAHNMKKKS